MKSNEMTHFQVAAIGVAVAAIAVGAWTFRYEVVPVARGGDGSVAAGYQLDRWTGKVHLLFGTKRVPVVEQSPAP